LYIYEEGRKWQLALLTQSNEQVVFPSGSAEAAKRMCCEVERKYFEIDSKKFEKLIREFPKFV
jgi:uncharacterized protein YgfB (UPF0149 family)